MPGVGVGARGSEAATAAAPILLVFSAAPPCRHTRMPTPVLALPPIAAGIVAVLAFVGMRLRATEDLRTTAGVPVLDLRDLRNSKHMLHAATHLGAFRLRGHRLGGPAVLNASRTFFSQPDAVKRSARSANGKSGGFERGYIPLAGESGLRQFVELKEGFCYGREGKGSGSHRTNISASRLVDGEPETQTCESLLIRPNAWPVAEPDATSSALGSAWRAVMLGFLEECISLTDAIGESLSVALGDTPSMVAELAKGGEEISLMRLFHYFAPGVAPELAPGVPRTGSSPHTDWHLMTIILQDATGGLQVRRPRAPYDWIDVPAAEGELVVILGDYMSALAGGRVVSPIHRVLLPSAADGPPHNERFSFTYFRYPRCDARVPSKRAAAAERRAKRRSRQLRRHPSGVGNEPFNTLIRPEPEGSGLATLAASPFGQLLLDKWRGVASNKRSDKTDAAPR